MDATYNSTQDIIYAINNPEPASRLVRLVNGHKEALKTLSEIFKKSNPPAVPLRVPVREVGQKKLQYMNREGTQMKRALQKNKFNNVEPLRVTIVEAYRDELQPANQSKIPIFSQSEARI